MTEWRHQAQALADELSRSGDLTTQPWRDAIMAVPRHELVPHHYLQNADATWQQVEASSDSVYADTTLITALADVPPESGGIGQLAVSSSTMPSIMVRMLEALDVRDGHRVLEIGTGSGYNAALLAHRLGSDHVFSVDFDAELAALATRRLASIGYTPTIRAGDGALGLPAHAPYDRIIATCAVPAIPLPWLEQTVAGGLILADLKLSGLAGNLVLLERHGTTATGRFLPGWAGFMNMRHANPDHQPRQPYHDQARERRTSAPLEPWEHTVPWFLAMLGGMPPNLTYGWHGPADTWLSATDGSWCEVSAEEHNGTRRVLEGGPVSLWRRVEEAWERWHAAGKPDWPRFGLTVTPDEQVVWLDEPGNRLNARVVPGG